MNKIKKIWNCIWIPMWYILIGICLFMSIYASYKVAKRNTDMSNEEETELNMKLGAVLTENILQRYDFAISKKVLDSIYKKESEQIIKNIYKK